MKSETFIFEVLPKIKEKLIDRADKECEDAKVKIYWAGKIVRIDIEYKSQK